LYRKTDIELQVNFSVKQTAEYREIKTDIPRVKHRRSRTTQQNNVIYESGQHARKAISALHGM